MHCALTVLNLKICFKTYNKVTENRFCSKHMEAGAICRCNLYWDSPHPRPTTHSVESRWPLMMPNMVNLKWTHENKGKKKHDFEGKSRQLGLFWWNRFCKILILDIDAVGAYDLQSRWEGCSGAVEGIWLKSLHLQRQYYCSFHENKLEIIINEVGL